MKWTWIIALLPKEIVWLLLSSFIDWLVKRTETKWDDELWETIKKNAKEYSMQKLYVKD